MATASAGRRSTTASRSTDERTLIAAAVEEAKQAKIAALMLPGLGTKDDITRRGRPRRVGHPDRHALHRGRHLDPALRTGPRARISRPSGFLMMAHSQTPEVLATQARIMADAGCQCVYVVDSAGAMILDQVSDRVGGARRRARQRRAGRLPRSREPRARRRQLDPRHPGRRDPDRRLDPSLRRRRRATRRARRSPPCATSSASAPASTCCDVRRRRGGRAAGDGRRVRPRPPVADHGLRRRVLVVPQARVSCRRAVRGVGRRHPPRMRRARLVGGQEDEIIDIAVGLANAR